MTKLEKINRQIEKLENKKRIAKNRLMLLNQRAKYLKKKMSIRRTTIKNKCLKVFG